MDTNQICDEVGRLTKELDALENQRQVLETRITPLRKELEHWTGILDIRSINLPFPESSEDEDDSEDTRSASSEDDEPAREYGYKARKMKEFVLGKNGAGITMKEIISEAAKYSPHQAFAYQFVKRQRKAKPPRLEKRGQRFFATQAMTLD